MPEHSESTVSEVRLRGVDRPATAFTSEEKRRIFKSMVVGELEAGFLRYSKREELIRYAAHLGLSEFDAMLLIAEAQYHAGDIEPVRFESAATLGTLTRPDAWSIPMRLSFALVAAIFIDLLLIYWLCM
ncbi:MAG TPA: hypothetical protein PKG54_10365 [Phycisphaerae bacterium]|jgi:hypothetical protein|nr:hypothetical protein [Phycisphaerae bacterium]HOB74918.1 hypothetical protein [Phycisphaerae bacterium]HOJ53779.1 hypothetical protein [Phycisphaerae bacterium]HOL27321.1 hypothetical protein [Phycisphaerae bacterium]HPP21461.1 hypothetical protein [Phycisphaerae bacterium]